MTVKAILFDLDNTLVDRHRSLLKYAQRFVDNFSTSLGGINVEAVFPMMVEVDQDGYLPRDEFFDKLLQVLPWVQHSTTDEIKVHWFSNFPMCSETFEDVHHVIAALKTKGIGMGIVTNGRGMYRMRKLMSLAYEPM